MFVRSDHKHFLSFLGGSERVAEWGAPCVHGCVGGSEAPCLCGCWGRGGGSLLALVAAWEALCVALCVRGSVEGSVRGRFCACVAAWEAPYVAAWEVVRSCEGVLASSFCSAQHHTCLSFSATFAL